jgi:hypothetical protein
MEKYSFEFDKKNTNKLIIRLISFESKSDGKIIKIIACPPIENGIDIIDMFDFNFTKGYNYNYNGLILISNKYSRKLYHKGELVAKINR